MVVDEHHRRHGSAPACSTTRGPGAAPRPGAAGRGRSLRRAPPSSSARSRMARMPTPAGAAQPRPDPDPQHEVAVHAVRSSRARRSPEWRATLRIASPPMRYTATSTAGAARRRVVDDEAEPGLARGPHHRAHQAELVQGRWSQPAAQPADVVERLPRHRLQPDQPLRRRERILASTACRPLSCMASPASVGPSSSCRSRRSRERSSSRALTSSCRLVSSASVSSTACTARPPCSASSPSRSRSRRCPDARGRTRPRACRPACHPRPAAPAPGPSWGSQWTATLDLDPDARRPQRRRGGPGKAGVTSATVLATHAVGQTSYRRGDVVCRRTSPGRGAAAAACAAASGRARAPPSPPRRRMPAGPRRAPASATTATYPTAISAVSTE